MAVPIYAPTHSVSVYPPLPQNVISGLCVTAVLTGVRRPVVVTLIGLLIRDVEHSCVFFGKMSVQILG